MKKRILECSSAGDARFSAFYAEVEIFGVTASIEEHYQLSKRFLDKGRIVAPESMDSAKGLRPYEFVVRGIPYKTEYLTAWFTYLWIKFLDSNPKLVKVLKQYDDYSDMFKGRKTINCQADVIRRYMHEGRESLIQEYGGFFDAIETNQI